jgi:superfamily II DNA or RNA helicase
MNNTAKVNKYFDNSDIIELPEKDINEWYLSNRAGIIRDIPEQINSFELKESLISSNDIEFKKLNLFDYQKFVREYLQLKSPYRGLLLYHSLGSGKSITAISTSELLLKERKVTVILPAYLESNFIDEVKKYENKYYTEEQYWEFISKDNINVNNVTNSKINSVYFNKKKMKGIWITNNKKKSNFNKLSDIDKKEIRDQITNIIENRYEFIHYDGLTKNKVNQFNKIKDYFENKLIIIDEVHNFIQRVVNTDNNEGIAKDLYDLLLATKNSKFICLSGTPMINKPVEIAYIVNLLKGYEKIYSIKSLDIVNSNKIDEILLKEKNIDFYEYDNVKKILKLKLLPFGFEKTKNNKVKRMLDVFDIPDDTKIILNIINNFKKLNINFEDVIKNPVNFLPLPINETEFNKFFINEVDLTIKNPELFKKRILGSISYYSVSKDSDIFPKRNKDITELFSFSEEQFMIYLDARIKERGNEEKKRKSIFVSNTSDYRSASRAICNFTFPKEIIRPYPKDIKYLIQSNEIDDPDADIISDKNSSSAKNPKILSTLAKKLKDDEYDKKINECLHKISIGNYLDEKNLIKYSPKYNKIYENIQKTNGTVLFYSNFRNVEGIKLFSKVLDKRGYTEFKIKKVGDNYLIDINENDKLKPKYIIYGSDKKKNKLLLYIFNSEINNIPESILKDLPKYNALARVSPRLDVSSKEAGADRQNNEYNLYGSIIKIFMITKSGSEGISLKNVRQVHILEPYWNLVRIEQVIGRAIRANSHMALPLKDRTVDVFKYLMKFTKKQLDSDFTIKRKDNSNTTDEMIDNIAQRKYRIISKLQELLKEGSIDCLFHHKYNPTLDCLNFPINIDDNKLIIKPDINEDELNSNVNKSIEYKKYKIQKVIILQTPFLIDLNSYELFDYNLYIQNGIIKSIGFLEKLNENEYKITVIKKYLS